jgi:succinate dehydrogenase hydrophobic anchor subunit
MPLEQEIEGLLIGGYGIVLLLACLFTIWLWIKSERAKIAYFYIFIHLVLFFLSLYNGLKAVTFDYTHPMASEEISFRFSVMGVLWGVSMIFLFLGIFKLTQFKRRFFY